MEKEKEDKEKYNEKYKELKWSTDMIHDLVTIVSYFKQNKLGEMLEVLGDHFINRHSKKLSFENYTMDFVESVDADKINNGEYKLAFICELVNSQANKKRKLKPLYKNKLKKKEIFRDKSNFNNVYNCLAFMIKYSISRNLDFRSNKPDNRIFFLTSVIRENLFPEYIIRNKDDVDVLTLSYYLTSEIINVCQHRHETIYEITCLMANTENLDISICSNKQIREIMDILKTRKTLFARILLVLAFEISKIEKILDPLWIQTAIKIENYEDMTSLFNSPLIETMIFLTSERIKNNEEILELEKMFDI